MKSISFLIDSGRSEAKFNQGKGRPTFPDAESSYSNLAILMEQEKFSDDMDPQEMSENLQLLRSRTLSRRLVDEIFSPFRILSPTHLCPLSPKRKEESSKRTET
jgi:hypothetical protein